MKIYQESPTKLNKKENTIKETDESDQFYRF